MQAHALYTNERVTAFRVPDGKIAVDGRPERIWRALSVQANAVSSLDFTDMSRLVLLQPEDVRNKDPATYVRDPVQGQVSMLAAYDNAALYFLFLVKTQSAINPRTGCTSADNAWKFHAPDVFLDPNTWVASGAGYQSYFSTDANGLIFGTSPKTIEVAKQIFNTDARFYFRNRATADKFQIVTAPSGVLAVSSRANVSDTSTMVVEMRIPYWGGLGTAYAGNKSAFISWGFNLYPDTLGNCNGNPFAYRWAKHYLNYDAEPSSDRPPGWRKDDSTHYDPTRSWDGWGQFTLSTANAVDSTRCQGTGAVWNLPAWKNECAGSSSALMRPAISKASRSASALPPKDLVPRDARGRAVPGTGVTAVPAYRRPSENAGPPGP